MQYAERVIAGRHIGYHDAQSVDVEYLREGEFLFHHLAIDAVDVLFTAVHLGGDAGFGQGALDRFENFVDTLTPVSAR